MSSFASLKNYLYDNQQTSCEQHQQTKPTARVRSLLAVALTLGCAFGAVANAAL